MRPRKVVWPTRKETTQMTGYVFAFVVVMALFLWMTDKTLEWVLRTTWSWAGSAEQGISMSEEQVAAAAATGLPKRWYVVHAYSGMERGSRAQSARAHRPRRDAGQIRPHPGADRKKVVELKNGKKAVTERRFFPGYVLVEMLMDDDSWHLVKHTSKVTGFVGGAKNRRRRSRKPRS